ncbi:MAG: hypothetical protein HKN21_05320, partial [Candidatus Eisenbacteria bacterium]|nr:hypothetical protein [Candidatus Eisenbacteria bacterium]
IMSLLLFGRSLDELDSDQVTLLQNRTREMAAALAASKLEAGLSRQLGVDMVTIRQGQGPSDQSSVVVGKYLSRRALLKYEQVIESGMGFMINLEYTLLRQLKLETLVGSENQSAVELNWSTEY